MNLDPQVIALIIIIAVIIIAAPPLLLRDTRRAQARRRVRIRRAALARAAAHVAQTSETMREVSRAAAQAAVALRGFGLAYQRFQERS